MSNFGNNLPFSNLPIFKSITNFAREAFGKLNPNLNQANKSQTLQQHHGETNTKTNPSQSLTNTNSNINVNPTTQADPAVTQHTLNAHNKAQVDQSNTNLKDIRDDKGVKSAPNQTDSQGAKDLPSYAGVPNMSLKSWVANRDAKSSPKSEFKEKELAATMEGIKGFNRKNYEGFGDDAGSQGQGNKKRNLFILSHIFSNFFDQQSGIQETETLTNIINFKKLGAATEQRQTYEEEIQNIKLAPPAPEELLEFQNIDYGRIKYLYQLLALPREYPEAIRFFSKEYLEILPNDLHAFLERRFTILQEQLLGAEPALNKMVANFVPLLNQNDFSLIIPFVLLYYPLPLPQIRDDIDFLEEWKKSKAEHESKDVIVSSCQVYYMSNKRGRFLLKFMLTKNDNFSFDIQTSEENHDIVNSLEEAISEITSLLEHPPNLSDLNVLLTREIYEATDNDEELAINSNGPLRIEILLAVYASLMVLNKLNVQSEPDGVIEMENAEGPS